MRRFTSGTVDQVIYFVAVDSTDLKTRETGLSSFTVYRARNGAAAVAYTTPTIAEVSSANMPGVYSLLLDEDMTIGAGNDSEEVVLHITQAAMAPVTLIYELYRPKATEGETLTIASGTVTGLDTKLNTIDDFLDTEVAAIKAKTDLIPASPAAVGDIPTAEITAIKAKTDSLTFTVAGQVDSNLQYVNDVQVNGTGAAGNEWGP
jgi:hypothetical protein